MAKDPNPLLNTVLAEDGGKNDYATHIIDGDDERRIADFMAAGADVDKQRKAARRLVQREKWARRMQERNRHE